MSDSQGPPDLSAFMPQNGAEGQPAETGEAQSSEESISADFLKNVPDSDRAVVSRYIKDWDAGVTKRFQEIHSQYEPYKQLGDVQKLQQAIEVYDLLDNSPEIIYETLKQHFGEMQQQQPQPVDQQTPQAQQQQLNPQLQQALDPFLAPLQQKLQEQQGLMEKMAQVILQGNQREQEAAEDRALDQYLSELETRHGKFDQRAILMGLYEGKDGDVAVKEWKDSLAQYAPQPQQNNVPPPLGGGSVPNDSVDVGQMSDKDVRALTANVFAALQNPNQ
jgi:type VI protein secretion system component VasK